MLTQNGFNTGECLVAGTGNGQMRLRLSKQYKNRDCLAHSFVVDLSQQERQCLMYATTATQAWLVNTTWTTDVNQNDSDAKHFSLFSIQCTAWVTCREQLIKVIQFAHMIAFYVSGDWLTIEGTCTGCNESLEVSQRELLVPSVNESIKLLLLNLILGSSRSEARKHI